MSLLLLLSGSGLKVRRPAPMNGNDVPGSGPLDAFRCVGPCAAQPEPPAPYFSAANMHTITLLPIRESTFFSRLLIRFRHFCSGSLALASLNLACRHLVPTFPQRSPPLLLTTAACGGLRSTPDCRPRRALLHLSYSYAAPCGPVILVTQDPSQTSAGSLIVVARKGSVG